MSVLGLIAKEGQRDTDVAWLRKRAEEYRERAKKLTGLRREDCNVAAQALETAANDLPPASE